MPTTEQATTTLIQAYIDAVSDGASDRIRPLLSPRVKYRAPPHAICSPRNVVAYLEKERAAFPDLTVEAEHIVVDRNGRRGVVIAHWRGRRLSSRICLVIAVEDGVIAEIESFGGLARLMYDVGLLRAGG